MKSSCLKKTGLLETHTNKAWKEIMYCVFLRRTVYDGIHPDRDQQSDTFKRCIRRFNPQLVPLKSHLNTTVIVIRVLKLPHQWFLSIFIYLNSGKRHERALVWKTNWSFQPHRPAARNETLRSYLVPPSLVSTLECNNVQQEQGEAKAFLILFLLRYLDSSCQYLHTHKHTYWH